MRDLPPVPHLRVEALDLRWVPRGGKREELEGDGDPELQIVGPIDFAHASTTEEGDDAVSAEEDLAGSEASGYRRG
jgi:hypothetical protein